MLKKSISVKTFLLAAICLILFAVSTKAHTLQCNGTVVPDWVKSSCCGKADYHIVPFGNVTNMGDHYDVIVEDNVLKQSRVLHVPAKNALPSLDGCTSIFFPDGVPEPAIYCFFFTPSI